MIRKITEPTLIPENSRYAQLVLEEGAVLSAPEGKNLSMTVDGVHTNIVPGIYTGDVVLTVTDGFGRVGGFGGPPGQIPTNYTAAIRCEDGKLIREKSVLAAVSGTPQDAELHNAVIRSEGDLLGGIDIYNGGCTISNVDIAMNGYGGNDFTGMGAAVVAGGNSEIEIDQLKVRNAGVIRSGVIVMDDAEVTVRNSEIVCMGGDDAQYRQADADVGGMLCVPWQLGLQGNCRATSVLSRGSVDYINCSIQTEGWGALSVDGTTANDNWDEYSIHLGTQSCKVEVLGNSGYGAFAIGPCMDNFVDTEFHVPDYALIQANETASANFTKCNVYSKRFGVMSYANQGGALKITDSVFRTGHATFLIKGCYPQITVENSTLESADGVLLQMIDCDDPNYGLTGMDLDAQEPVKIAEHDVARVNYHDFYLYNKLLVRNKPTDVQLTYKDMSVRGDMYNAISNTCPVGTYNTSPEQMGPPPEQLEKMIEKGEIDAPPPEEMPNFTKNPSTAYPANLAVTLEHADYTGRISASVAKHAVTRSGKENYHQLGMVTNTVCPVVNNGVLVTVKAGSSWTVTGDCFLSALTIEDGAEIKAPIGKTLLMTIDGIDTEPAAGTYTGNVAFTLR